MDWLDYSDASVPGVPALPFSPQGITRHSCQGGDTSTLGTNDWGVTHDGGSFMSLTADRSSVVHPLLVAVELVEEDN